MRRPPFFVGPSLKRAVTIELNAFTTRAPGARPATTSLAPLPPRSASTSLGLYSITRAKHIVMRSRRISARQAYEWGVATDCVADGELEASSDALAEEL